MFNISISDQDRKLIRHILVLYRTNSYKYVSKLDLHRGVYKQPISKDKVNELISLFDLKGSKSSYDFDDKLDYIFGKES